MMTSVEIFRDDKGGYAGFFCRGHAGYARPGQPDIVCSAVSLLVINTVNALEQLARESLELRSKEDEALIECRLLRPPSREGEVLLDAMVMGLREVASVYGKRYVKIIECGSRHTGKGD